MYLNPITGIMSTYNKIYYITVSTGNLTQLAVIQLNDIEMKVLVINPIDMSDQK